MHGFKIGKPNPIAILSLTSGAEWSATDVVNHSLVAALAVPSVWPPGNELPRREWALLNPFRTEQSRCAANLVRWKQSSNPRCSCGEIQTMSHIVDGCIETRFPGALPTLHLADEAAVQWIGALLIS